MRLSWHEIRARAALRLLRLRGHAQARRRALARPAARGAPDHRLHGLPGESVTPRAYKARGRWYEEDVRRAWPLTGILARPSSNESRPRRMVTEGGVRQ